MEGKRLCVIEQVNSICKNEKDFVMAASFEPYISQMKDPFHYDQAVYNAVGKTAGKTIADFYGGFSRQPPFIKSGG